MECAQVTEEQRLWIETQIQKGKAQRLAELSSLSLPDTNNAQCNLSDISTAEAPSEVRPRTLWTRSLP